MHSSMERRGGAGVRKTATGTASDSMTSSCPMGPLISRGNYFVILEQ
jgi:hypothetical protein